jgi:hypothetical protein
MLDVRVVLRSESGGEIDYNITPRDTEPARLWMQALQDILRSGRRLDKNYCFVGFPNSPRDLDYLCQRLNRAAHAINTHGWQQHGLAPYVIEDWFAPDVVRFGPEYGRPESVHPDMLWHSTKHEVMNRLHNHFERLQGTVESPSPYFLAAPQHIRQEMSWLNTACHEIETLVLSQRKAMVAPEWIRPSQITQWPGSPRYGILGSHKSQCLANGFDRRFGHVYMHWAQIGKTLFEVFRDEEAPVMDATTCEAITHLLYYTGEFDVEWGRDVVTGADFPWHNQQIVAFQSWLVANGYDPRDPDLMLGYVELGEINTRSAFGTSDPQEVWQVLEQHLDIARIECGDASCDYPYTWRETDV